MNRIDLIKQIEDERGSKVITYLTGDRAPQFTTTVGEDVIPILYRHLEKIGERDKIDLLLYTRGGDMVVPIRIVKLIRSYCKAFSVLVPFRCHSAGTLICLGSDGIVMTKIAELTPVDPTSAAHHFNPKIPNPANPQQPLSLPVSVEDVRSYLAFAKEQYGANKEQIVDLYSKMTNQTYANSIHLHPLALGNVYRVQKMIKMVVNQLLAMHFKNQETKTKVIERIVHEVTENICIHNYPIYFDEAKSWELNVSQFDRKTNQIIMTLFDSYASDMKLSQPFNAMDELGSSDSVTSTLPGAYIESTDGEDVFNFTYEVKRTTQQINMGGVIVPMVNINLNQTKAQWDTLR